MTREDMSMNDYRMSSVVQIGATRVEFLGFVPGREKGNEGIEYRVVAPVLDYFGTKAVHGAMWVLQHGIAPASEGFESIRARQLSCYGRGYGIVGFQGRRSLYPYVRES